MQFMHVVPQEVTGPMSLWQHTTEPTSMYSDKQQPIVRDDPIASQRPSYKVPYYTVTNYRHATLEHSKCKTVYALSYS